MKQYQFIFSCEFTQYYPFIFSFVSLRHCSLIFSSKSKHCVTVTSPSTIRPYTASLSHHLHLSVGMLNKYPFPLRPLYISYFPHHLQFCTYTCIYKQIFFFPLCKSFVVTTPLHRSAFSKVTPHCVFVHYTKPPPICLSLLSPKFPPSHIPPHLRYIRSPIDEDQMTNEEKKKPGIVKP